MKRGKGSREWKSELIVARRGSEEGRKPKEIVCGYVFACFGGRALSKNRGRSAERAASGDWCGGP